MTSAFQPYVAKDRKFGPFVFDFHIADEVGQSWYDGSPDQFMPERQWCLDHVGKGFTVFDCGAHHGMMTVLFSLMTGPAGRVLAWEALPENAEVIRRNTALNHCDNVTIYSRALGAGRGNLRYERNSGNINVFRADSGQSGSGKIEVRALDDDLRPEVNVDFLKLDVEGSERDVMRGARRVLAQRPIIDLELHNFLFPDRFDTLSEIFAILDRLNYSYEALPEPFDEIVQIGPKMDIAWLEKFYNPHVFCTPL
jgi:FkbM family methyltransferase